jgi:alginate O-acetyltransferase complex protein AlgI
MMSASSLADTGIAWVRPTPGIVAYAPKFCLLLAGVTLANEAGAVLVERTSSDRSRNTIVAATVAVDLLALGFFRYYGFFVEGFARLFDHVGLGAPLALMMLAGAVGTTDQCQRPASSL